MKTMARIEIVLVWESNCRNILDELLSLPEDVLENIKLRIFLRKDTPLKNRPPTARWIETYDSFTTAPYASDTTMAAFLVKYFKDLAFFGSDGEDSGDLEPVEFYFVVDSDGERGRDELVAILTQGFPSSRVKLFTINGETDDMPTILGYSFCRICCKSFESVEDLQAHNIERHNIFCDNELCEKSRSPFKNLEELSRHKSGRTKCLKCGDDSPIFCDVDAKMRHMQAAHGQEEVPKNLFTCDFCPKKSFSSTEQRDIHVRNTHKKCNCGCGIYFETREDYLAHFYAVYPLACFENRKCPHRFQTVYHQAEHHRNVHDCEHPYYCVACSTRDAGAHAGRIARTCAFRDAKALKHHGSIMGHRNEEMFFVAQTSCKPTAKSSAINYC